jgi:hypothetical protein
MSDTFMASLSLEITKCDMPMSGGTKGFSNKINLLLSEGHLRKVSWSFLCNYVYPKAALAFLAGSSAVRLTIKGLRVGHSVALQSRQLAGMSGIFSRHHAQTKSRAYLAYHSVYKFHKFQTPLLERSSYFHPWGKYPGTQ